jgi:hypothetical protein
MKEKIMLALCFCDNEKRKTYRKDDKESSSFTHINYNFFYKNKITLK